ncbi:hypothetical protein [Lachnoclostridium sp. Marseille-P6806]|uniref:hypothetical protein n=1 Tax=Lachnoclostridium sp. Marseille-P6806 TaxID=2364793 RepID=UPI001031031F|nr:hypothetical protein [Lachnoclostridium sp. Marseille-P6806]
MPFWRKRQSRIQIRAALRACSPMFKRALLPLHFRKKRDRGMAASMTVEASFVLPLVIFFLVDVLFVFDMMRLQSHMLAALHETGTQISEYCYYYRCGLSDVLDLQAGDLTYDGETGADAGAAEALGAMLFTQTFVRSSVERLAGREYLDHSCLCGGASGISYLQSSILSGDDAVDLVADYRVCPFIRIPGVKDLTLQSRFYAHAWVGYDTGGELPEHDGSGKETMVYITDTGTVYHRSAGCSYLNPSIRTAAWSELAGFRNRNGGKYYPCEICSPHAGGTVLITADGNRYHASAACPGLKRTVHEVPLSSVEGRLPPCSKCGGSQ